MISWELQKKVFDLISSSYKGKKNGAKARDVADYCMPLSTKREFRRVCHAINENPQLEGIISTSGKIYLCDSSEEAEKAIRNTYRLAFSYLRKARKMEEKFGSNGQIEFLENDGTKVRIIYGE